LSVYGTRMLLQGGLVADLTSTVATLQSVVHGITQVRRVMQQFQTQSGLAADESLHSTDRDC